MFFDQHRYDESDWRNESEAAERSERRREAMELAEYYAETPAHAELPAIMADDAGPIGMSCEDPEPVSFGMELSTTSMLRARFGKRVA